MSDTEYLRTELAFALLANILANVPLIVLLSIAGSRVLLLNHGEASAVEHLWWLAVAGFIVWPSDAYLNRKANLTTQDLGVNAISFTTPVAALALLFLFGQVGVAHIGYLVVGAIIIVAGNLIVNFRFGDTVGIQAAYLVLMIPAVPVNDAAPLPKRADSLPR